MREQLTDSQEGVLKTIVQLEERTGKPPTITEIAEEQNRWRTAVYYDLKALERKGHIERKPGKYRGIRVKPAEKKLVPVFVASDLMQVLEATTNELDEMPCTWFPLHIFADRRELVTGRAFLAPMPDDSMVETGIHPGDFLVVKRGSALCKGDIALVSYREKPLIRRWYPLDEHKVRLQPENIHREEIETLQGQAEPIGKVIGVLRASSDLTSPKEWRQQERELWEKEMAKREMDIRGEVRESIRDLEGECKLLQSEVAKRDREIRKLRESVQRLERG